MAMTSALLGSRSSTPFTLSAGLKKGLKRGGRGKDFFGSRASKEQKWGFFQKNGRITDVQKQQGAEGKDADGWRGAVNLRTPWRVVGLFVYIMASCWHASHFSNHHLQTS
ncbi:MAG: hypothetical protein IPM61_06915 [Chlorobi bacterium]|nr:hypothetical protein [Chlorobiota bacterium]MBX7216840.1 hypothetical protein [Candidatus Kapabacteria bacterium]